MLIWGLPFAAGKIIWGLKCRGPKCVICGLKFAVGRMGSDISCLSLSKPFSWYQVVFKTGQLIIWWSEKIA